MAAAKMALKAALLRPRPFLRQPFREAGESASFHTGGRLISDAKK
jgi:hypothetical protein